MDATLSRVLKDSTWTQLQQAVQKVRGRRGRPSFNDRAFFDGVVWILRTGAPWRDLPQCFGRWQTVYRRFSRWSEQGLWARMHDVLRDTACTGMPSPSLCAIDSTAMRVHQHGAPPKACHASQAVGSSRAGKTTKLHAAVSVNANGSFVAWKAILSPGQRHDICASDAITQNLPASVQTVIADRAYDARSFRRLLQERGLRAVVPYRRGGSPKPSLDKRAYGHRNIVERFFARIKQYRRVATRYDRLATRFLGFLYLAFSLAMTSFGAS